MYIVIAYSPQQAQLLQSKTELCGCKLCRTPTPRGLVKTCAYSYLFEESCFNIVNEVITKYNIKIYGVYMKVFMYGRESYEKIL
jgi:hypothetical protein